MSRSRVARSWIFGFLLGLGLTPTTYAQNQNQPVPPSFAATPEDGQWTMPTKNFAGTRYSDLSEINTDTVKNLQVAFTFSVGVNRGQEASPW